MVKAEQAKKRIVMAFRTRLSRKRKVAPNSPQAGMTINEQLPTAPAKAESDETRRQGGDITTTTKSVLPK